MTRRLSLIFDSYLKIEMNMENCVKYELRVTKSVIAKQKMYIYVVDCNRQNLRVQFQMVSKWWQHRLC